VAKALFTEDNRLVETESQTLPSGLASCRRGSPEMETELVRDSSLHITLVISILSSRLSFAVSDKSVRFRASIPQILKRSGFLPDLKFGASLHHIVTVFSAWRAQVSVLLRRSKSIKRSQI
jgi:hypothetical protein